MDDKITILNEIHHKSGLLEDYRFNNISIDTPIIELQIELKRINWQIEIEKHNRLIKDIAILIKNILMSGCDEDTMNIMNSYIEDIKNLFIEKGNKVDFLSSLTNDDKLKITTIFLNLTIIATSKTI
jgi:hypothetical protein